MDLFSLVTILLISTVLGTLLGSAIKDFKRERYTMFGITITMWLVVDIIYRTFSKTIFLCLRR